MSNDYNEQIPFAPPSRPAYERCETRTGPVLWTVWRDHCGMWHWHDPAEGHRAVHCRVLGSPYAARGCNLAHAGPWPGGPE